MLTALGYQPWTTSTNLLLIRLILTMPPSIRYGVDGPQHSPSNLHETCLHRTPYSIHGSLAYLEYPLLGGSCQATFRRVTPVYGPKRPYFISVAGFEPATFPVRGERATKLRYTLYISGWLDSNQRSLGSKPRMLTRLHHIPLDERIVSPVVRALSSTC